MGKWVSKPEVFAAAFSVVTLWSCLMTFLIMAAYPGVFGSSALAPLVATYGPGVVGAVLTIKKTIFSLV